MIAHGVNKAGKREILAIEPMFDETEDSWRAFFRKLKSRGLKRPSVHLRCSSRHPGCGQEGRAGDELAEV